MKILNKHNGLINIVIDTSSLMNQLYIIENMIDSYNIILPIVVVEELDNLKKLKYGECFETCKKARKAISEIEKYKDKITFIFDKDVADCFSVNAKSDYNLNDNIIVTCCFKHKAKLITDDLNLKIKAEALKVECLDVSSKNEIYTGYKEIVCKDEIELAKFYENLNQNTYNCLINEYLIIKDTKDKIIDKMKWNGESYKTISSKKIKNDYLGIISPINLQQELAFDMLQDKKTTIKILDGIQGSGKDYCMISHAIEYLKQKKYDKIYYVRNNIEVKDSKPIGHLPDGIKEKLMPFAMPLADHLGGVQGLEIFLNKGEIEIAHLGFARGRDLKRTIIYCSEAENMTKEHIQLLISRLNEDSSIWINGDCKQIDARVFEINNGLSIAIDRLKGRTQFGYVKFNKVERSDTANLAQLLD